MNLLTSNPRISILVSLLYLQGAFSRLDPTGEFRKRLLDQVPAGRLGEVEEHANLACFLLSDYASWITGATVTFDGGQLPYAAGMMNPLSQVGHINYYFMITATLCNIVPRPPPWFLLLLHSHIIVGKMEKHVTHGRPRNKHVHNQPLNCHHTLVYPRSPRNSGTCWRQ